MRLRKMVEKRKCKVLWIAAIISLGGSFHFGYQLTSVNPSETVFRRFINGSHFSHYGSYLDDQTYRVIWSVTLSLSILGDFLGAPFLVVISEKLGRKRGLYLASAVFGGSFLLEASSKWLDSFELFACARCLMGLGDGWTVAIQTMYLSECSPKQWRGLCGGITGVFVELGLIAGALMTLPEVFGTDELWPYVYISETVLILLMWLGLRFMHESPKYLAAKGELDKARESLLYFEHADVEESLQEIVKEVSSQQDRATVMQLFQQRHLRRALLLGALVWFISTFSGIEVIDFFSTRLFMDVGFSESAARYATIAVSCQAFVAALVSSFIVDRVGRRPLLLITTAGLAATNLLFMALTLLYSKFGERWYGYLCVIVQFVWIFFFGVGPAVLQWTVTSEVMPQNARSTAVALINMTNLLLAMAARMSFLPLHGLIGAYSFLLYIVPLCVFAVIVFYAFPETKNRSIVEIMRGFGYKGDTSPGSHNESSSSSSEHEMVPK